MRKENEVSDQDKQDQRDDEGAEVEGHSLEPAPAAMESLDSLDATEEPPDVEGHSLDPAPAAFDQEREAMDPRPDA
jgi:hypothetical protein